MEEIQCVLRSTSGHLTGTCRPLILRVSSCEYVVLREHGVDEGGVPLDDVTRFHGDLTRDVFVSRSDSVLLQFCYRSETFSARNIAITYKAISACFFLVVSAA